MRCLYCDKLIDKISIQSLLLEEDRLCEDCRKKLVKKKKVFYLGDLKVTSFYEYEGLFKSLLLQYKECYDEALAEVFLYDLKVLLKIKYWDYGIAYVPSSKQKIEERGFYPLKGIYDVLNLKEVKGLHLKKQMIQEGRNKSERQEMINNVFYDGEYLNKVLIVDDVCTTGSSLYGVYNALKNNCKKIEAIVLSKK